MLSVSVSHDFGRVRIEAAFEAGAGITALVGASGAGKSSIANAVSGMLKPQSGRIAVGGRVLLDTAAGVNVPPHRRRVAQVFQDARLFPHLSVRDNLLYGWRRVDERERTPMTDVAALIERLGLGALLDAKPRTLSGGESQRVALGRALLAQPDVLVMDEPLAALDSARKQEILPHFETLRDQKARPILYVTHALDEVARLADAVIVLHEGRIVDRGVLEDVLPRLSLSARDGHGRFFVIHARVESRDETYGLARYAFAGGWLEGPDCGKPEGAGVRLRIRASDVMIALNRPEGISALNVIPASVRAVEPSGPSDMIVRLETNGVALLASVTRRSANDLGLRDGQPVFAIIKAVNVLGQDAALPDARP